MEPVNSSSGESGSGDSGRRDQPERRSGPAPEVRSEAWRLIHADGSRTTAPGRVDETVAAPRVSAGVAATQTILRSASRSDHGEELDTLSDFLQDEDLTLLDLDLLSDDMSLLSAEMVPADEDTLRSPNSDIADEPAALAARDLAHVVDAWPHLSADLRQAILWIAKGGRQAARYGY